MLTKTIQIHSWICFPKDSYFCVCIWIIIIMKSLFRFHKTFQQRATTRWTVDLLVDFYGRIKFIPNWLQFIILSWCQAFVHKFECMWAWLKSSSFVSCCSLPKNNMFPFTNGTYWFHWLWNHFGFDSEVIKGKMIPANSMWYLCFMGSIDSNPTKVEF